MTDFLLELRSEEIPARMQAKARDDLARLFAAELAAAGLAATETVTFATPRRLALIARGLPAETEAVSEEVKGPKASAPPQALEGFLRKTGLTREQLTTRDGVFFAVTERPGRATAEVLAQAIPAIVRAFPWPKAMRWGATSASTESPRWVRPLHGIVALFGTEIVECEAAGVRSGAVTKGHRFHHPGDITIGGAADYAEKLRACHVIVDQDERAAIIATGATTLTAEAGLSLVRDEGLLAENAGLTEWPVPLLGRFDAAFLDVPPEVIQLTARVNQKYFVATDAGGKLAEAFVCVANIAAADGGANIVEGNRKVLAARLSDARFFYDTDLKTRLEDLTLKLEKIVFHEKLGTVADKVERVAKLAEWLAREGIVPNCDPALARRAAELCKADLVTGMVGEFPELQGLIGGYYAAAQGKDPAVAAAIRDHYKPVGQGDEVPTAPVTVAVSLADKLDSLISFFCIEERPSGSRDPFALRRAALGIASLIVRNRLSLPLNRAAIFGIWPIISKFIDVAIVELRVSESQDELLADSRRRFSNIETSGPIIAEIEKIVQRSRNPEAGQIAHRLNLFTKRSSPAALAGSIVAFIADRLKVQQRDAGVRHDLIDAVFALGGEDDLVRLLARVRALQAFVGTDDGANLLAGYKRAANILKKEGVDADSSRHPGPVPGSTAPQAAAPVDEWMPEQVRHDGADNAPTAQNSLSYMPEPAEERLIAALDAAEPAAAQAVAGEDFEGAMTALASLRSPIDAFFDSVTVNDPDPAKRAARLALLARVRGAVHGVADFSKIEG